MFQEIVRNGIPFFRSEVIENNLDFANDLKRPASHEDTFANQYDVELRFDQEE